MQRNPSFFSVSPPRLRHRFAHVRMRVRKLILACALGCVIGLGGIFVAATSLAQSDARIGDAGEARQELHQARSEAASAQQRGEKLEVEARAASEAAEKTARQAAALAARIQQAEAGIAAAEAHIALIGEAQAKLNQRLAQRRAPLIRLTGALQKISRRPLAFSALRPGSLRETVYLRAMLESTIPEVRLRTAALRNEIKQAQALEREAQKALITLRKSEADLAERRKRMAAIESRQRVAARLAGGEADRETERALALAEQARDLDALVDRLDASGSLREELEDLPGPVMRPVQPESVSSAKGDRVLEKKESTGLALQLPADGRIIAGFGSETSSGARLQGITIAPRAGAQLVAPAAGRVAFSGPFRGFGRITIIEHDGGMTSLITGLARTDVTVGQELVAGSPLGIASQKRPSVTYELRKDGKSVNPLDYVK